MFNALSYIRLLLLAGMLLCLSVVAYATNDVDADSTYDESSAVIFVYHRIGEDQYPASNLRIEQFKAHLKELQSGGYNVKSVEDIIDALQQGYKLPKKTVGITFEGAYASTFKNAVPLLKETGFPYTIFFAPDRIDWQSPGYMSWKQLRKLAKNKHVTLAAMPASYVSLIDLETDELSSFVNRTLAKFREELDMKPALFSYPYGEYSETIKNKLAEQEYKAAFGQHSGVPHKKSDFYALPRFSMTESYGGIDRFRLTANALPLPVSDLTPIEPVVTDNPPHIGFTVVPELSDLSRLSCFASGNGRLQLERLAGNRIEIRHDSAFIEGRVRINCTMPTNSREPGETQQWRWFGMMLSIPENAD